MSSGFRQGTLPQSGSPFRFPTFRLRQFTYGVKGVMQMSRAIMVLPEVFLEGRRELTRRPVLVRAYRVRANVGPVSPTTARRGPSKITTPIVRAFHVVTIRLLCKARATVLRVRRPWVNFFVPG